MNRAIPSARRLRQAHQSPAAASRIPAKTNPGVRDVPNRFSVLPHRPGFAPGPSEVVP